jgi:DNA-binding CsgD family transcriptional regulator
MTGNLSNYDLFYKFIHTYSPLGFRNIDFDSLLMKQLDELMERNNQFFLVGDLLQTRIIYASSRCFQLIGIKPSELDLLDFINATHQDDLQRYYLCRAKMVNMAKELYLAEKGAALLSTNLRLRNAAGGYTQTLFQEYMYFVSIPYKSVFILQIHTNIDWWKPAKNGFHHYVGNDLKLHRYPDNDLLNIGIPFSSREFEIIKLIALGMRSDQIAEKLFLSINTVSTHRKNIIDKTGKHSISELIYELMEKGLL